MNGLSGNKKIIISIACFVIIMAAIVGVLFALGGSDGTNKPANSSDVNDFSNTTRYEGESTSSAPVTDSPAMNFHMNATEGEMIEAYISGKYYISSVMYADGVESEMDIAIDGYDFQTTVDMDGMKMGIMYLDDEVYFINDDEKKYINLDSISAFLGGEMDLDMSELKEITAALDLSKYAFHRVEQTEEVLDGQSADCYRYYSDEISICFWFVAGELRQIDYIASDGEVTTSIEVKAFSPEIPSGMLTLSGLKKSNLFDFFGEEFMMQ